MFLACCSMIARLTLASVRSLCDISRGQPVERHSSPWGETPREPQQPNNNRDSDEKSHYDAAPLPWGG